MFEQQVTSPSIVNDDIHLNLLSRFFKSTFLLLCMGTGLILIAMDFKLFLEFAKLFHSTGAKEFNSFAAFVVYCLLCYGVAPLFLAKYVIREKFSSIGIRQPVNKIEAVFLILAAVAILLPFMVHFSKLASFKAFYSCGNACVQNNFTLFTLIQFTMFPLYYLGEEFFFRGFLFLGLWKKIGWHSFWVTDILFTFSHIGKPGLEILLCIPASVVFNFITLRSRSILPAFIVHCTIGISLSYLVNFPGLF
jgi:membrane protease YdiL (CAAX protease family)